MSEILPSQLATSNQHYEKLGIKKEQIEKWEDGLRTDGTPGTFEWWYFDVFLDDGSTLVIVFYTKPSMDPDTDILPLVTFILDTPDGKHFSKEYIATAQQFKSSKDACEVFIGPNVFKGDLDQYTIHFEMDEIIADVTLKGSVPSWRPATGHIFFGEQDENYFAWLPSVPQGEVEATITINGTTKEYKGTGYHDHNWGNISMARLLHHWYWGRAKIGEYTVISSYITSEKSYGYRNFPIFMLAKGGNIIADNALEYLTFRASEKYIEPKTGKPAHNRLEYEYNDGQQHYRITYVRQTDILCEKLIDRLPDEKRALAEQYGFDGGYLRFSGEVILEKFENDQTVEKVKEPALWELMYFGKNPE